jgi:hypothetical protein
MSKRVPFVEKLALRVVSRQMNRALDTATTMVARAAAKKVREERQKKEDAEIFAPRPELANPIPARLPPAQSIMLRRKDLELLIDALDDYQYEPDNVETLKACLKDYLDHWSQGR